MNKIERKTVYDKFDGRCAYCGSKIEMHEMQVDHIIPKQNYWHCLKNHFRVPLFLSHLTIDDCEHIDNKFPSCRVCNKWKSVYDIETFREEISAQPQRLMRDSSQYRMASRYSLIKETNNDVIFYFEKHGQK